MNTLGWGPNAWDFLFLCAFDSMTLCPKNPINTTLFPKCMIDKSDYIKFFTEILASVLPCKYCRDAWTLFTSGNNAVVEGCYGTDLKFFISANSQRDDIFLLWLYIMKNKVTNKIKIQEDKKMAEELSEFNKNNPTHKIPIDVLTKKINAEKNILRINRESKTYNEIYEKYEQMYREQLCHPTYFPFLLAVAFNIAWATSEGNPNTLRLSESGVVDQYITFFNASAKFMPCEAIRICLLRIIQENPLRANDFLKDPFLMAKKYHQAFLESGVIDTPLLPKLFGTIENETEDSVINRYKRWKVACSTSGALKTCRASVPDRNAPLLSK